MKQLITIGLILISTFLFSQEKAIELNCYNKWAAKFEDRGAEEIKDGVYEDVIITNRQGAKATCHNGKAEVRNGRVVKFYILLSDGSHEEVKRTWKSGTEKDVNIINGISKTMVSVHNELINVLWPNSIKPKKAKPIPAAEPTDD
jgi:hypothetical protein